MNNIFILLNTVFYVLISIMMSWLSMINNIDAWVVLCGLIAPLIVAPAIYSSLHIDKLSSFLKLTVFTFINAFGSFVVLIVLSSFGDFSSDITTTVAKTNEIAFEQKENARKLLDSMEYGLADEMLPDNGITEDLKKINEDLRRIGENIKNATTEPSQLTRLQWAFISSFGPSIMSLFLIGAISIFFAFVSSKKD
jgi:hypothetical protein